MSTAAFLQKLRIQGLNYKLMKLLQLILLILSLQAKSTKFVIEELLEVHNVG